MAQKNRVHRLMEPLLRGLWKEKWSLVEYHGLTHKRRSNMTLRIGLTKAASHLSSPPFGT
ncbi:hypothetical protein HAX54_040799, partial [Datura stramonium]|nr:hypothetical protein [Datura stramonium]